MPFAASSLICRQHSSDEAVVLLSDRQKSHRKIMPSSASVSSVMIKSTGESRFTRSGVLAILSEMLSAETGGVSAVKVSSSSSDVSCSESSSFGTQDSSCGGGSVGFFLFGEGRGFRSSSTICGLSSGEARAIEIIALSGGLSFPAMISCSIPGQVSLIAPTALVNLAARSTKALLVFVSSAIR